MKENAVSFNSMQHPLLDIKNLTVSFPTDKGSLAVVNNISFKLQRGEMMAMVGESGSGKSITSQALMRLLPSQAELKGQLLFSEAGADAIDLATLNEKESRSFRGKKIALIFQEPMTSLNPMMSCGNQVSEAIRLHEKVSVNEAKKRVLDLFERVDLPNPSQIFHKYPHQLSGGQRQRVMIAMAISCNPCLLIADEPTTALDVTVQKKILELLKRLQLERNMGILLVTHDLGLVADFADSMVVLNKGELLESGTVSDVLQHPNHPYTKALLACRPTGKPKNSRLPVVSDFMETNEMSFANTDWFSSDINRSAEPVLKVCDLSVHYPIQTSWIRSETKVFKAVEEVSFEVFAGETVGLVGESGCGKSTLGKALLRLIRPSSGSIHLNGTDLAGLSESQLREARKDVQMVFQDPYGSLNPRMTIGDALIEPMKTHGLVASVRARREQAVALLEKVNLKADHFHRYPHQFSGGQRQRISIARALVLNPAFIVFDESVSALDVSIQAQVLNLLNELKREFAFSSLFISHDLSVVRYISDRMLVMQQGKIVESGMADEIFSSPTHPYTKILLDAVPGKKLI